MSKLGDCFEAAAKYAMRNPTVSVVHAMAIGRGPIQGVAFSHAWVEEGDSAIEVANGMHIEVSKPLYYAMGNIDESNPQAFRRYTAEEARKRMLDTGHYGPWDIDGETRHVRP